MAAMTWSDDEEFGSENEIEAKEVDAFDELMIEFKKVGIKNSLLKKMASTLSKDNEDYKMKMKN